MSLIVIQIHLLPIASIDQDSILYLVLDGLNLPSISLSR